MEEATAQRAALEKVTVRLRNRSTSRAFRRWREFAAERVEQRKATTKALVYFINAALVGAFSRW